MPALILLLPVGFAAGALPINVHPSAIFGPAFPALVAAGVAVILYDACLSVNLRFLTSHTRQIVTRLIVVGSGGRPSRSARSRPG